MSGSEEGCPGSRKRPPAGVRARLRVVKAALATAVVLLIALTSASLLAAPDFSTSAITADPAAPLEGDVVTFTVVVRNTGDQESPFTQVSVSLPGSSLFIDYAGLEGGEYRRRDAQGSGHGGGCRRR